MSRVFTVQKLNLVFFLSFFISYQKNNLTKIFQFILTSCKAAFQWRMNSTINNWWNKWITSCVIHRMNEMNEEWIEAPKVHSEFFNDKVPKRQKCLVSQWVGRRGRFWCTVLGAKKTQLSTYLQSGLEEQFHYVEWYW